MNFSKILVAQMIFNVLSVYIILILAIEIGNTNNLPLLLFLENIKTNKQNHLSVAHKTKHLKNIYICSNFKLEFKISCNKNDNETSDKFNNIQINTNNSNHNYNNNNFNNYNNNNNINNYYNSGYF